MEMFNIMLQSVLNAMAPSTWMLILTVIISFTFLRKSR
jgi:hypothetical protein